MRVPVEIRVNPLPTSAEEKAELSFDTGAVNFVGTGTSKRKILYKKIGEPSLVGTISTDSPRFLTVTPSSLSPDSGEIEIALDTSEIKRGEVYTGHIVIAYNGADSPQRIPVYIRVPAKRWLPLPALVFIAVFGLWALYSILKEPRTDLPPPVVQFAVMATKDVRIRVRRGPATSDGILGPMNLRKGELFTALENRGEWYKVKLRVNGKDTTGWIQGNFLLPQSEILRRVKEQLAASGFPDLNAEFDASGILAISGTVTDGDQIVRVNTMVSGIPGVGKVDVGRLRVEPRLPPPAPPEVVSVERVSDVLSNNGYRDLRVTISGNGVAVAGIVNTDQDINKVRDIIQSVPGVGRVDVANLRLPITPPPIATVAPFVQPLPPALWNAGQEHVQKMITYASVEGGLNSEAEIEGAKRGIEGMNIKNQLVRGNRRIAREANDRGLKHQSGARTADALRAFQEAWQADRSDVEVLNNLGYAYMLSGDLNSAEQSLALTLLISPARAAGWVNIGQVYAKKGNEIAAVACFANTYRFSRDRNKAYAFFRNLGETDDDPKVKEAVRKALQLRLIEGHGQKQTTVPPPTPPGGQSLSQIIEARLRQEGFDYIRVQEIGSELVLTGEVRTLQELDRVKEIAFQQVAGRSNRVNWTTIKVVPEGGGGSPGSPTGTGWLARKIIVRLQDAGFTQIKVEQSGPNEVTLRGEVRSGEHRDRVLTIAKREIKGYPVVMKWEIDIVRSGQ